MKKAFHIVLLMMGFFSGGFSQPFPILDNYLFNPVSISPAFTGKTNLFQAFLTYRNEWVNIPGGPIVGALNVDGALNKNMGIGGNIQINKAGPLTNFMGNLNYAYHLQLAKEHFLSFAVNVSVYQNSIDLDHSIVGSSDDPLLQSGKRSETYMNVGTSLLYTWKDLNVCIGFPVLFNNKSFYNQDLYHHVLTMDRNWLFYTNYTLDLKSDWKLKFDLLYRNTQYTPWTIEFSTMVKYHDSYWLGVLYRKSNIIGITAGLAIVNALVINYNYEFSGSALLGNSAGTHEISVGYMLKRKTVSLKIKDYNTK